MGVRILDDVQDGTIPVSELGDGQLGKVTHWTSDIAENRGTVVQHFGDTLVPIGRPRLEAWHPIPQSDDCRVRVLPNGTRLEVTDNE